MSPRELSQEIERRVRAKTGWQIRELVVRVHGEGVTLQGLCNTFYAKQLAQEAAMSATQDAPLSNQIFVENEESK